MGPVTYAKHLISGPRLPFSAAYFGSIGMTLFFAIKVRPLSTLHYIHYGGDYHARLLHFQCIPTISTFQVTMIGLLILCSHDSFTVQY